MTEVLARYTTTYGDAPVEFSFGLLSSTETEVVLGIIIAGDDKELVRFVVDTVSQTVTVTTMSLTGVTGLAVCLLGCGIAAATPPIIKCLKSSKPPKVKNFTACLKRKGIDILADAAKCAVGCAFSGAGGGAAGG